MNKIFLSLVFSIFFLNSMCFAGTLYLKNGKEIQGQIIGKTDRTVRIDIQGVVLTYDRDDIEKIVDDTSQGTEQAGTVKPMTPDVGERKFLPTAKPESLPAIVADKLEAATPAGNPSLSSMNKKDLILALIEASGAKENMNQMFSQIIAQAEPQQSQKLRKVFDVNEVVAQLVPIYDRYFTDGELKDLIAFYQSPLGRKLLLVTPQIMQDSMNASLIYFQKKMQSVQNE